MAAWGGNCIYQYDNANISVVIPKRRIDGTGLVYFMINMQKITRKIIPDVSDELADAVLMLCNLQKPLLNASAQP